MVSIAQYLPTIKAILPFLAIFVMNGILLLLVAFLGWRWFITRPVADAYYKAWKEKGTFMGIQDGLGRMTFASGISMPDQMVKPQRIGDKEFPAFKQPSSVVLVGKVPIAWAHSETNACIEPALALWYNEKGEGLSAHQLLAELGSNPDKLHQKQFLYHCYNEVPDKDNPEKRVICNNVQDASSKEIKDRFFEQVLRGEAIAPKCIVCGENKGMKAETITVPYKHTLKNNVIIEIDKVVKGLQLMISPALEERRVMSALLTGQQMKKDSWDILKLAGIVVILLIAGSVAFSMINNSLWCKDLASQLATTGGKAGLNAPLQNITKTIGLG